MKKKLLALSLFGLCAVSTIATANPANSGGGQGGVIKPAEIMDCIYDAVNNRYICKKPN